MIYLDTSALLKSLFVEDHSDALRAYVLEHADDRFVSSVLLSVELRRAVQRVDPRALPRADLQLTRVDLVGVSDPVVEAAGRFPDPALRSLDALHLATAVLLREEITALVTYDKRLAAAAAAEGLPVVAPAGAA